MRKVLAVIILALSTVAYTAASPVPRLSTGSGHVQRAGDPNVRVWVNTDSGVYHCPGTRWYGKTKQGQYMSQRQAQAAGYRPAYGSVCG